ncbi:hypothetical protein EWI73_15285 [Salmonella bongori]|uniref:Uncharacterized protein n=1 Tax=Salmonella bongori TaxID=54736 RepID=A0A8F8AWY9_SALBN|nr:hypothetical protein [Salmonella bongori]QXY85189.1 hypothetical protein EWI73_15285 [Salmonella bongori]
MGFAPHIFLYLLLRSVPDDERLPPHFWRLLKRSACTGEKTVSKRVINGKSHLAITRLAVE